jgi:hypothetical protein
MRSIIFIYIYFLIFSFLSLFIINDSFIYLLTHKILNLFNYIYIYITFNLYLEFSIYIMFLIKKILDQLLLYKLRNLGSLRPFHIQPHLTGLIYPV